MNERFRATTSVRRVPRCTRFPQHRLRLAEHGASGARVAALAHSGSVSRSADSVQRAQRLKRCVRGRARFRLEDDLREE